MENASNVTFSASPQAAPGEMLTNGETRDTGQLSVAFSDSNLLSVLPADLYVKSTDFSRRMSGMRRAPLPALSVFSVDSQVTGIALGTWKWVHRGIRSRPAFPASLLRCDDAVSVVELYD